MKALARSMYWWPGINKAIEKLTRNYDICNVTRNDPPKAEIHEWEPAEVPLERVHVDYAGPYMNAYFFVFVDVFSKWPIVQIVKDITAETTIRICKEIFTDYWTPKIIKLWIMVVIFVPRSLHNSWDPRGSLQNSLPHIIRRQTDKWKDLCKL